MPAGGKPTVRSRRLGAALKRLRLNACLDQEHAADAVACSTAKISRIESGTVSARVGDVRVLLDLYEVEDVVERQLLEKLARDSNKRGWWMDFDAGQPVREILGDFLSLESDATYIRTWQPVLIPGLLQTPEYTRALTDASPDVISEEAADMVVKVRQERRRVFEETGARFAAVIWEAGDHRSDAFARCSPGSARPPQQDGQAAQHDDSGAAAHRVGCCASVACVRRTFVRPGDLTRSDRY